MNFADDATLQFQYYLSPSNRLLISDFTGPVAGLYRLLEPLSQTIAKFDKELPNELFRIDPLLVQSGSLLVRFLLRCVWEDEEEGLLRLADKIRKSKTVQAIKDHPTVLTAVAAIVLTSGLIYVAKQPLSTGLELYDNLQRLKGIESQIEDSREKAIEETSSILLINPDTLREISLNAHAANPPSLKSIQQIARPLQRDPGANLQIDASKQISIPRQPVIDLANMKKWLKPRDELKEKVNIVFHAADIDSRTRWAAVAPEIYDGRVPVRLHKDINRVRSYGTRRVIADVRVIWTVDNRFGLIPKQYIVLKIQKTAQDTELFPPIHQ